MQVGIYMYMDVERTDLINTCFNFSDAKIV